MTNAFFVVIVLLNGFQSVRFHRAESSLKSVNQRFFTHVKFFTNSSIAEVTQDQICYELLTSYANWIPFTYF